MATSEEELAISVQKYPVFFDKSNKDFHRKDVQKNSWQSVVEELGLEDGK